MKWYVLKENDKYLINKPIEVKRFVELKNKLRNVREEIKDIIVEV